MTSKPTWKKHLMHVLAASIDLRIEFSCIKIGFVSNQSVVEIAPKHPEFFCFIYLVCRKLFKRYTEKISKEEIGLFRKRIPPKIYINEKNKKHLLLDIYSSHLISYV